MAVLNKVWGVDSWGVGRYSDPGFEPLTQIASVSLGNVTLQFDGDTTLSGETSSSILGVVTPKVLLSTQGQVAGVAVGTVSTTIDCIITLSGGQLVSTASAGTALAGGSVLAGAFNITINLGESWRVVERGYDETYTPETPADPSDWVEIDSSLTRETWRRVS